jgi:hypothetical protein
MKNRFVALSRNPSPNERRESALTAGPSPNGRGQINAGEEGFFLSRQKVSS